ncbi:MAG: hypothetical protein Q8P18_07685 [Pseudomonadota bacterium]|nr:hypothetical protein [Pseudomonadota bacterium]
MSSTLSSFRPLVAALVLAAALSGCDTGPSAEDLQKGVESAIAAKDYPGAVTKADEALKNEAVGKDPAKAWRFESMRLQALADGGKGADVVTSLDRLRGAYDKQVTPALYRSLADKLKVAGDGEGTVTVLDAGLKRFPEDPSFQAALDDLKNSVDPEEIEKLKALGYL